jgi:hypothetical protein
MAFCQSALERTGLEVESLARHQWAHSACCTTAMVRISPSWWYNFSTLSAYGGGNVSRRVVAAATFWKALAKVWHYPPHD